MAHDVFISYSTENKTVADAVCAGLESRGVRCWIAPRDARPGLHWQAEIIEAIDACKIFVIIMSADSNCSDDVLRELQNAASNGVPILPFRIEDTPLSPEMRYYLGTPHWLDALTPPLEQHIGHLGETVSLLLDRNAGGVTEHGARAEPEGLAGDVGGAVSQGRSAAGARQRVVDLGAPLDEASSMALGKRLALDTTVYACHSSKDLDIVRHVKRSYEAMGVEYVMDATHIGSGDDWAKRTTELIAAANIFQLFWSSSSMASDYVGEQWRCALALDRENFIRPVYWEQPLPPVPLGLAHLHFSFLPIAVIQSER